MDCQTLRRRFLKYFESQGHRLVPSSPVVPLGDPTLLFTNAGMNQFKDVFLGTTKRDYSRAATAQKCVRVGGKHNDLENVGHTRRHLTFFEMLGNFSFGDYFKKEAIAFAWEVATEVFAFDPDKIFPTVFDQDEEAYELWLKYVPGERITKMGEKDNFWSMGDTGPCGPCSELYYDRGEAFGGAPNPAKDTQGERYLEFWNLVFMQYNQLPGGSRQDLPRPSIDTGSGLERVALLKTGCDSVFDTDILRHIISSLEKISGHPYGAGEKTTAAFRVIADHIRTLAFAISDGVQPSNVDRGYVLRKVLRRAVRYGRILGMKRPFLSDLLPALKEKMGGDYPQLMSLGHIEELLTLEEESFLRTLQRGGNLMNQMLLQAEHSSIISGEAAFKLKDTYGLPLEEIQLLAKDSGLKLDIEAFERLEQEAKERSRASQTKVQQVAEDNIFATFLDKHPPVQFIGYDTLSSSSTILAILSEGQFVDSLQEGMVGSLILDKTPFYAEMGGQVGDTGFITTAHGQFLVQDTKSPYQDVICHLGCLKKGFLRVGEVATAEVDQKRRQHICHSHTTTHLLHWALQEVLGPHIRQAGSVVAPNSLRFDFSHHKKLSDEELEAIERKVNRAIFENWPVVTTEMPYQKVQQDGTIKQFFGDKYGKLVRVVDAGGVAKELCGGTHVKNLAQIGLFKIIREGSIAAGMRRIEALTKEAALDAFYKDSHLLTSTAKLLETSPSQLLDQIQRQKDTIKEQETTLKNLKKILKQQQVEALLKRVETLGGISVVIASCQDEKGLKELADALSGKVGALMLTAETEGGRCQLLIQLSKDLVQRGLSAAELMRKVTPLIQGQGGGKQEVAQAGGSLAAGIPSAQNAFRESLRNGLTSK